MEENGIREGLQDWMSVTLIIHQGQGRYLLEKLILGLPLIPHPLLSHPSREYLFIPGESKESNISPDPRHVPYFGDLKSNYNAGCGALSKNCPLPTLPSKYSSSRETPFR